MKRLKAIRQHMGTLKNGQGKAGTTTSTEIYGGQVTPAHVMKDVQKHIAPRDMSRTAKATK